MARRSKQRWFIVDDQSEVDAFCSAFNVGEAAASWTWIGPSVAVDTIFSKAAAEVGGVLVDIDLSGDIAHKGTGLGLAQDLRAKQKAGLIANFPIIRFANPQPVSRFVGIDQTSDDLFDLLLSKEQARSFPKEAVAKCLAIREVYEKLSSRRLDETRFAELCGVNMDEYKSWVDARLLQQIFVGASETNAVHVATGLFIRSFLEPNGLLIDEELLSVRLGVNISASGNSWPKLLDAILHIKYSGLGAYGFKRWWARGIEGLWASIEPSSFLQELPVSARVKRVAGHFKIRGLKPLHPEDARYWRLCSLSKEQGRFVPIDPRQSVKMISTVPRQPWLEPEQADPSVALMNKDDPRLDKADLKRIGK